MERAGWQSVWSRGSLAPSPQLQGGLRGSEGSQELALLGSGGRGSDMKLIRVNLEIAPCLWHRHSLFCVSVALGVKVGTCVRTGWHRGARGKAKGQQSQGVTETHRLGSSPSSTCCVTLGLYFLSLSPHLETEDVTESTSLVDSPGTVYVSPSTPVHRHMGLRPEGVLCLDCLSSPFSQPRGVHRFVILVS